jgi:protein SCO1
VSKRPTAGVRWLTLGGLALLAAAVVAVVVISHSSSSGAAPHSTSSGSFGTAIDHRVPGSLRRLPLTNQHDQRVDLASWPDKTVVLVPFLTLCSDICPLTTGNLLQVEKSLHLDHAASRVEIVEISVDPTRDIPARLAAYAKLTGADWQLVTEPPRELAALAGFFGFSYEKVPEDKTPSIDWWTGKPLTYDINHSDNYFVIDPTGTERVVQEAAPDFHGRLNPRIYRFLSAEGRQHLEHPPRQNWTPADLLAALGLVLHQSLPAKFG